MHDLDNAQVRHCKAVLMDLDGTVYFKGAAIPGAVEAVRALRHQGLSLRFLTNTDSKTTCVIHGELVDMGLEINEEEIFTPVTALQEFMKQNPGNKYHLLVSKKLVPELEQYSSGEAEAGVDYVVVGDFREYVNYDTLNTAFRHLVNGAELIALQKGRYFVTAHSLNIDTGAFVALLEYASGKAAKVLGKPSPDFFNMALQHAGCDVTEAMIVGDDITTDIAGAKAIGARAVLVKTGKYNAEQVAQSSVQPDDVLESVAELPRVVASSEWKGK